MIAARTHDVRIYLLLGIVAMALFGALTFEASALGPLRPGCSVTLTATATPSARSVDTRTAPSSTASTTPPATYPRWTGAMELASGYALYAIAGIAAVSWFVRSGGDRERRLAVYTAAIATIVGLAVTIAIQHVYVHERPFVARSDVMLLIPHAADPSFPSEHATAAFALAAGIALYRWRIGAVLLVLAALVGFSRIYVGVHYPADVIAAAGIGARCGGCGVARAAAAGVDRRTRRRVPPARVRALAPNEPGWRSD